MSNHSKNFDRFLIALFTFLILIGNKQLADAAESGRQTYLLGFRSSLAGIVPPPGVYIQDYKIASKVKVSSVKKDIRRIRYFVKIPCCESEIAYSKMITLHPSGRKYRVGNQKNKQAQSLGYLMGLDLLIVVML